MKNHLILRSAVFAILAFLLLVFVPARVRAATLTVTNNTDSGTGSLRDTLANASSGDVIAFANPLAGGNTIELLSPLSIPRNNITIDGTANGHQHDIVLRNGTNTQCAFHGIMITASISNTVIKGLVLQNFQYGIYLVGSGVTDNVIQNNYIGTTADGTSAAGNCSGIVVRNGAHDNVIGGITADARNVISGNSNSGIHFAEGGPYANNVYGNYIGTNASGTDAVSNMFGITIASGSGGNIIGWIGNDAGNLISGNGVGIVLRGHGNSIQGNLIGTDWKGEKTTWVAKHFDFASESLNIPGSTGINISQGAQNNYIGGTIPETRNVISGNGFPNGGDGIFIDNYDTYDITIRGNYIGIAADGISAAGNEGNGITVFGGTDITIVNNSIAHNGRAGILVTHSAQRIRITENSIFQNTSLGVDLAKTSNYPNGVTTGGCSGTTGGNNLYQIPVIKSVTGASLAYTIGGTSCPNATVELYVADADQLGYGEGKTFLLATEANNKGKWAVANVAVAENTLLTATATSPNGDTSEFSANKIAEVIADLSFRPDPNGYHFENYGGMNLGDYTVQDMRRMFGDNAVCIMSGTTCKIRETASQWRLRVHSFMRGGHCDGFTSTGLRFFKGIGDAPSKFQKGATTAHDLELSNIRRHIAYYFALQIPDPVAYERESSKLQTPNQVLEQLRFAMSGNASDPTSLIIERSDHLSAHSITPYAIEDKGNGISWIKVYDSNHPGDANRKVIIDTNNNNWSYDLGSSLGTWSGNASSHTLGAVAISHYTKTPECPWCGQDEITFATETESVQAWLEGSGHLLITDTENRRLGFVGEQFVNEIPDAFGSVLPTGLGISQEPIYYLPSGEAFTTILDGTTLTQSDTASFVYFGPGYAVTVEDLIISTATQDQITISGDGKEVSYQASDTKPVNLALSLEGATESNEFQIKGADIAANQRVKLNTDSNNGTFAFSNKDAGNGEYSVSITRISSSGFQPFAHEGIQIAAADTHYFRYGDWNTSTPMQLEIDQASDGTIDQTIELDNQACTTKPIKPALTKPKNGASVKKKRVLLNWDDAICADTYSIIIREGSKKGPKVETQNEITISQFKTRALMSGKTYFWRVTASNGIGSTKSAWRSFTVQ